jgi:L-aspartate oxidase (EC 1.4.3.16)
MASHDFDVLIVGSGLAGLSAALHLAPTHRVAVITKRQLQDGASAWAQGGIAAVLADDDSFAAHIEDTLVAGAGLCDLAATRFVVENAPEAIAWLRQLGVPFSMEGDQLHLTREGGHSARRIAHVTDATGAAVQRTLIDVVRATKGITVFEQHTLVDVITSHKLGLAGPQQCLGLYALDGATDEVVTFRAPQTILATAARARSTSTPPTPTPPPATALPPPGAPVAAWATWSSSSFTPRGCTTRTPSRSSSARRCAARVASCCCRHRQVARASCRSTTSAPNWHRATWWPAPSTTK